MTLLTDTMRARLRQHFNEAVTARTYDVGDVTARGASTSAPTSSSSTTSNGCTRRARQPLTAISRKPVRMVIDEFTTYPGIKRVNHEYFYAVHGADATRRSYLERAYTLGREF